MDDGVKIEGLEVTEENFLGQGVLLRGFWKKDKEIQDLGHGVRDPPTFQNPLGWEDEPREHPDREFLRRGHHLSVRGGGRTVRGQAELSFGGRPSFPTPPSARAEFTHLLLPFLDQRWDISVGGRLGSPGKPDRSLGSESPGSPSSFGSFPATSEYVVDKDFSNTVPVDSAGMAEVQGQVNSRRANRVNLFLGQTEYPVRPTAGPRCLERDPGRRHRHWRSSSAWAGPSKAFRRAAGSPPMTSTPRPPSLLGGVWDGWVMNTQVAGGGTTGPTG